MGPTKYLQFVIEIRTQDRQPRLHIRPLPPLRPRPRHCPPALQLGARPPHPPQERPRQDTLDLHRRRRRPRLLRQRRYHRDLRVVLGRKTRGQIPEVLYLQRLELRHMEFGGCHKSQLSIGL